jgi:coenzyme F420 hydrogenase subunit beta
MSPQGLNKEELIKQGLAVDTGLCTMCGLCVAVCPVGALSLDQSETDPHIVFSDKCNGCGICHQICAGKDVPLIELDRFIFGRERDTKTELFGISRACYQAHATDPEIRERGSSGGVVTALLVYALEHKLISAATAVAFDKQQRWKAIPVLARTREEITDAAQSKNVVVPVNAALAEPAVKELSGPVGCVGLACHVHSLRKLQYRYPGHFLSKKTAFIIGVHCGSAKPMSDNEYVLKTHFGLRSLDEIKSLSYRKGKAADAYGEVVKTNGEVIKAARYVWITPRTLVAPRCLLCWDWGAELSDVSVGDFLGPAASGSEVHLGASTLIVRTQVGEQLVEGAVKEGYLKIYPTPVEPVLRANGLAGKKLGSAIALMAVKKYGLPCPDYQYEIEPMDPMDKASRASGVSVEDRERFWAERGIRAES